MFITANTAKKQVIKTESKAIINRVKENNGT